MSQGAGTLIAVQTIEEGGFELARGKGLLIFSAGCILVIREAARSWPAASKAALPSELTLSSE